jgi:hypothetical protein
MGYRGLGQIEERHRVLLELVTEAFRGDLAEVHHWHVGPGSVDHGMDAVELNRDLVEEAARCGRVLKIYLPRFSSTVLLVRLLYKSSRPFLISAVRHCDIATAVDQHPRNCASYATASSCDHGSTGAGHEILKRHLWTLSTCSRGNGERSGVVVPPRRLASQFSWPRKQDCLILGKAQHSCT